VNGHFGGAALALLSALHIRPENPNLPIPEHVVMGLLVLLVGTIFALWVRVRLSVERPGASQQIAELLLTNPLGFGITDVLEENAGHDWRGIFQWWAAFRSSSCSQIYSAPFHF